PYRTTCSTRRSVRRSIRLPALAGRPIGLLDGGEPSSDLDVAGVRAPGDADEADSLSASSYAEDLAYAAELKAAIKEAVVPRRKKA
ncbi:MAG TPA: hypothetical protein PKU97_10985, partial [Kofleriaceae bacterium]|nr:hypothetical protein [Kofleriaceae bacterium]